MSVCDVRRRARVLRTSRKGRHHVASCANTRGRHEHDAARSDLVAHNTRAGRDRADLLARPGAMMWASVLVASAVLLAGAANPVAASASTIPGGVVNLISETKEFSFADESDEAFVVGLASNDKGAPPASVAVRARARRALPFARPPPTRPRRSPPSRPSSPRPASPLTESERAMLDAGPHVAVVMTAHDGQRYFCELPQIPAADADAAGDAAATLRATPRSADARRRRLWRSRCPPSTVPASTASRAGGPTSSATASTCVSTTRITPRRNPRANSPLASSTRRQRRRRPATIRRAPARPVAHVFTGGTPCDLANLARETEVQFTCALGEEVNAIASIQEPSTCRYAFTFATPLVCGRGGFREAKKPPAHVKCKPVAKTSDTDEAPREETRGGDDGETRGSAREREL